MQSSLILCKLCAPTPSAPPPQDIETEQLSDSLTLYKLHKWFFREARLAHDKSFPHTGVMGPALPLSLSRKG